MDEIVPYQPLVPREPRPPSQRTPIDGYPQTRFDGGGIREYLAIIRRHFWLPLLCAAVAVGLAARAVYNAPPVYRAEAVIRLIDSRKAMIGNEAAANDEVLNYDTDILLSQIQIMSSRAVASEVVEREGLRLMPTKGQPFLKEITDIRVSPESPPDTLRLVFDSVGVTIDVYGKTTRALYGQLAAVDGITLTVQSRPRVAAAAYQILPLSGAIAGVRGGFSATPRPKTDVVDLQFVSTDPQFAQRALNGIALAFQQHNVEAARQSARRRRIFLEEQQRQAGAMLDRAVADYDAYRSGQRVFSTREKANTQQAGMASVDIRRADLNAQRRTYQSLLAQSQSSPTGVDNLNALVSAPGIAANPVIQQLYSQLNGYEARRDSVVSSGAAETSPDAARYSKLISATINRLVSAVRYQIQALDAQIEALDDLKAKSELEIQSAPRAETQEARLSQQVQTAQTISDKLKEDEQQARMAEAVEAGQVEIVDLAELPAGPLSVSHTRKLALALIVGLMLGIAGAVVIDGMNTSIRRRDDLEKVLQVPGLAVIPKFVSRSPRRRFTRRLPPGPKSGNGKVPGRITGLVTVVDARSAGAEAYRTLRTNLIFAEAQQSLRTIVVTSAAPSEGKTTTAANLAVSFAQQGMRVLLADCDLRRSRVHRMFSVARVPGLTECVLGNLEPEAVARQTSIIGLYVLPSGDPPSNPSELLGSEAMRKTLAALSGAFDVVIMDTPPILVASDATILATLVDGVVVVVRAGVTEAEAAQQAMQQLAAVGARVVGAVLNDPDEKLQSYGGYYKYEYASES